MPSRSLTIGTRSAMRLKKPRTGCRSIRWRVVRRPCESSMAGLEHPSDPQHCNFDDSITSPYLTSIHRGEQAWTALGSAIRVAQSLGLHRLTPEPENLERAAAVLRYGDIWGSRVDREVGRRIWCSLASRFGPNREFGMSLTLVWS